MPEPVFTASPVTTFMGQPRPLFVLREKSVGFRGIQTRRSRDKHNDHLTTTTALSNKILTIIFGIFITLPLNS